MSDTRRRRTRSAPPHLRRGLCAGALLIIVAVLAAWLPAGLSLRGAVAVRSLPVDVDLVAELRRAQAAVLRTYIAENPASRLAWNWGEGVLAFGIERSFQVSGLDSARSYVRAYLRHHLTRGVDVTWSDHATPALAAAERLRLGDVAFGPLCAQVADYAMQAPRSERSGMLLHLGRTRLPLVRTLFPEAWVDSLFHVVPLLLRQAQHTAEPRFRDEAVRQLELFTRALQDPRTGLVTHAYDDSAAGQPIPPFAAQLFWARGNGWMLVTLIDALDQLSALDPRRAPLQLAARRLAAALSPLQSKSGLFHTLLLRPDTYEETAGSALILAAMAQGMRRGTLDASVRPTLERGARGLLGVARVTASRAVITGTSLGTNPIAALYAWIPTADQISYGVGAWLLAASELIQALPERDQR